MMRPIGCENNDGWPSEVHRHRGPTHFYQVFGGPMSKRGRTVEVCAACARRIRLDWNAYLKHADECEHR